MEHVFFVFLSLAVQCIDTLNGMGQGNGNLININNPDNCVYMSLTVMKGKRQKVEANQKYSTHCSTVISTF